MEKRGREMCSNLPQIISRKNWRSWDRNLILKSGMLPLGSHTDWWIFFFFKAGICCLCFDIYHFQYWKVSLFPNSETVSLWYLSGNGSFLPAVSLLSRSQKQRIDMRLKRKWVYLMIRIYNEISNEQIDPFWDHLIFFYAA